MCGSDAAECWRRATPCRARAVRSTSSRRDGGALLPGLTDHHLHLFATAADLASAACDPATVHDAQGLTRALHRAGPDRHGWVRGVRYHESVAGELDASRLDALRGDVPVRVQHRSGALWMLNSRAVAAVGLAAADHAGVERDADGRPTGRLWRADAWLRDRLPPGAPPSLADLGRRLAGYGITTVTDATPGLDAATVAAVLEAMARAELPQRVHLLGAPLTGSPPGRSGPQAGPWKIVIADSALPGYDELAEAVEAAHRTGRPVAVHCVTREAILLLLAVLEEVGTLPGDRLEHASLTPCEVLPAIRRLGLRVVTQPGFLADRGDDYLRGTPPTSTATCTAARRCVRPGSRWACPATPPTGPSTPGRSCAPPCSGAPARAPSSDPANGSLPPRHWRATSPPPGGRATRRSGSTPGRPPIWCCCAPPCPRHCSSWTPSWYGWC